MRITEVSYKRVAMLSRGESHSLELTATLAETDDPESVIDWVKALANLKLESVGTLDLFTREYKQLERNIRETNELAEQLSSKLEKRRKHGSANNPATPRDATGIHPNPQRPG